MNESQQVRTEDQLDLTRIKDYLLNHLDSLSVEDELSLRQFSGGASNLTYELLWKNHKAILRTPPRGANIKSAHDMSREFKVLSLLEDCFPYSPRPILLCQDQDVIGRDFYLMEKVEGHIPRKDFPFEVTAESAHKICQSLMDVHIALHEIDINKNGLQNLGHPQGYIERQVNGWCHRYEKAKTPKSLDADGLMSWLQSHMPEDDEACLIHNDFKLDNVVFDPNNNTEIIAVLDWEMTTVGSPLMDLGCSLAYWIEASDPKPMQMLRMMPTHLEGMMSRKELVEYYAQKRNIKVDGFEYYYIFGVFRLAVIVQQIYQRFHQGKTSNPAFASFADIAKILIQVAESKI